MGRSSRPVAAALLPSSSSATPGGGDAGRPPLFHRPQRRSRGEAAPARWNPLAWLAAAASTRTSRGEGASKARHTPPSRSLLDGSLVAAGGAADKLTPQAGPAPVAAGTARWASIDLPEEAVTFEAVLTRTSAAKPLGIKLDCEGDIGHVCEVSAQGGTAVGHYNATAPREQRIIMGDYFLSINGRSKDTCGPSKTSFADEVFNQLLTATTVVVEVARPFLYEIEVQKKGSLGMRLTYSNNNGRSLVVAGLEEGAGTLLDQCEEEVEPGDRIIAVNRRTGRPRRLLAALGQAQEEAVALTFSRPLLARPAGSPCSPWPAGLVQLSFEEPVPCKETPWSLSRSSSFSSSDNGESSGELARRQWSEMSAPQLQHFSASPKGEFPAHPVQRASI